MSESIVPEGVESEAASARPSSDLAASYALHEARRTPHGRATAAAFLAAHKAFIDLQAAYIAEEQEIARRAAHLKHVSDVLKIVAQVAFIVVGLAIVSGVVAMWWNAITSNAVVVDTFEAPAALADDGFTGSVVAGKVLDALLKLQDGTRLAAAQRKIRNAWSNSIELKLPEAGISLSQISNALHRAFGHDVEIDGALVRTPTGLALSIRGDDIPPMTFAGGANDIDALARKAAEYIYGDAQPVLYATYLLGAGRSADAAAFLRGAFSRSSDTDRASLANLWGEALLNMDMPAAAEDRFRLAMRLRPHYWRAWNSLIETLWQSQGEEAAYHSGMEMKREAAGILFGSRPSPYDWTNFAQLTLDPGAVIAGLMQDRTLAQSEGAEYDASSWIAEQEAVRHDWTAVSVFLAESPPDDVTTPFDVQNLGGLQAMEDGHYAAALPMFLAADKMWHAEPNLRGFFPDFECNIGLAYTALGRVAQALPFFANQRYVRCRAYLADAIDSAGQWAAAQAAYHRAEAAAPDLAFAYYREGLAWLRHGDVARARNLFDVAHSKSPRWAEPLKGQGDAMAAQHNWDAALGYYRDALKLAQNWNALLWANNVATAHDRK